MKLTTILLTFSLAIVSAAGTYSQNTMLSVNAKNETIQSVLDQIEEQSEYHFFYNTKQINTKEEVSLSVSNKNIFAILDRLFDGKNVHYEVLDKNIILSTRVKKTETSEPASVMLPQQNRKQVTGVVVDETGEPVIGANVVEKGTTNGVVTGINGDFVLSVAPNATLQVTYIGYVTKEVNATTGTTFRVVLEEDTKAISEVVVTALGIKREEKALGYAVQNVKSEDLTTVKGVNVATSLTGKVAGVTVLNKNEFNTAPTILLRGESPLVVIDGVPFENTGLAQVSADDIEAISVLKGATASALYGSKGASGALMITTKRGAKEGLSVSVNSNTMFNMGYLVLPEVQSSYSSGEGGKYRGENSEYIWGDKLDIGRTAVQYDPTTYEWKEMPLVSKGKNNFKNFLETSFVLNNNVNVTYKGKNGSFRTSLTHVYNKGQFPGNKLNKFTYSAAGDMKLGKFSMDASITYNGSYTPQYLGSGYSGQGYMYNLIVWTGTDYDLRDFRDYWVKGKEDQLQNWHYKYDYNNPYYLAYENTRSQLQNRANAQATINYELFDWLKATARAGSDFYTQKYEYNTPLNMRNSHVGGYNLYNYRGYSFTGDALLIGDKKLGDFNIGGVLGVGLTYYQDDTMSAYTNGGITVPGYYSLKASKDLPSVSSSVSTKQTNSLYGKLEASWRSAIFLEVTGRNDWVSTLEKSERSYFYPSVSGSILVSELLEMPYWLSFMKLRSSWTMIKTAAGVYDINKVYSLSQNVWDGLSTAKYPETIRDATLAPQKSNAFEVGTAIHFLNNRIRLDVAYYTKLLYDIQRSATLSYATGFKSSLINYDEERMKKGWEVTLAGDVIKSKDLTWTATLNWGRDRYYYHKIDDTYSTDRPWVRPGERWDWIEVYDWERDPDGNIVHSGGMPVKSNYPTKAGFERADWVWGLVNHLSYKSFTLDVTFDGRVGGVAHNRLEQAMWNSGTHKDSDNEWRYDQVVNGNNSYIGEGVKIVSGSVSYDSYGNILEDTRVFAPNDVAVSYEGYIKGYHQWNGTKTSQNMRDLTFFKLRELAVGYKMPKSLLGKIGLQGAHLSLVGQNLFIWAKDFKYSDPDAIYEGHAEVLNSPSMRYVGLNIKIDF
ncbi:SusC/RagA family TonB-linked outer membrane protein [Parabacteroides sp. OttesenSCG-928-K15]|nr:SusC/RagA family TonB-linked outer membrane protein [Parabacteroides sp. OttesenSCG-928-K15]